MLKIHWVMVAMDQYTPRIVGFAVHAGAMDGPAICPMFGCIAAQTSTTPRSVGSDHDPLFEFDRWKANLRILENHETKTVPGIRLFHPFIERLIESIPPECLDHAPFWTRGDLERKLKSFQEYYNHAPPFSFSDECKGLLQQALV